MNEGRLTTADRIGLLTALILLSYTFARIIQTPQLSLTINLPGFVYSLPLNMTTIITLLAAGLTANGMNWLMQDHPEIGDQRITPHWLIPTLTTFVIGAPLSLLPDNYLWWAGLAFSAVLLALVFWAEYLVVSPVQNGYTLARASLTALAYALFLILTTSMRFSNVRLFAVMPITFISAGLISLRILNMDGVNKWDFPWAIGIGLICVQIGAGLHYWQLSPLQYGLAMTAPLYALTVLSINLSEGIPLQRAATQPLTVAALIWVSAIFFK